MTAIPGRVTVLAGMRIFLPTWLAVAAAATAEDWPQWRGTGGDAVVAGEPSGWTGKNWFVSTEWIREVGQGCTSPIAVGERVYVMGRRAGKDHVYCLNVKDGSERWQQSYPSPEHGRHAVGDKNRYGGPTATPVYDQATGLLFTLGCDGQLGCWQTREQGKQTWSFNLYDRYKMPRRPSTGGGQRDYGYITAPFVYRDLAIVQVGGEEGALMAFKSTTGEAVWRSECLDQAGHCGGMAAIMVEGRPCLAALTLHRLVVVALDGARPGGTVAEYAWETEWANSIPSPAVAGSRVLLTSAYNQKRTVCLEIAPGTVRELWRAAYYSGVCTPVVCDGLVYMADRSLHCLSLATGVLLWRGGKHGSEGSCLAAADGRIVVLGSDGLSLVESGTRSPDHMLELARAEGVSGKSAFWPQVVLANSRIYCKDSAGRLQCHRVGVQ